MTSSAPKSSSSRLRDSREYQRRVPRYRADLPLIVRVLGQDGYVRIHGRCTEISQAGLGAVTSTELGPGEIVALELALPDAAPMELRAVVRHRMGFLHGFEFVSLLSEQSDLIREFCRRLSEDL
ncbi:MAG TPA: PilZ domain-containing protein [Terriglobales bacterium]|nr:PilZ domain-containing protein [Terriglobales bacterium]